MTACLPPRQAARSLGVLVSCKTGCTVATQVAWSACRSQGNLEQLLRWRGKSRATATATATARAPATNNEGGQVSVAIPTTLAVMNGKGGVLKTSLVANLAGLAAAAGYRVLAVDLDPQGNLALDLGYAARTDDGAGLLQSLMFQTPPALVRDVRNNLDVLPGGPRMEQWAAVAPLQDASEGAGALQRVLLPLVDNYHVIVIDVPPGNRELQMLAAISSRLVIIPTQADEASLQGVERVARLFKAAEQVNPDLELLGVALTRVGAAATAIRRQTRARVNELFELGDDEAPILFDSVVRDAFAAARGMRERGVLAHEYEQALDEQRPFYADLRDGVPPSPRLAASGKGLAEDYSNLVHEVLERRNAVFSVLAASA